jgi:hypothetical protein
MKKIKIAGFMLALLFSAASASGQSRVVLDQSTNAVAFTKDNKSWGLEVNGNEVIEPGYKTVAFQNGLFKLEDWDNNWMVIDKDGNDKVPKWVKASDVKISEGFVLFEKANGGVEALIYDRSTWAVVKAKETSYDDMAAEVKAKYEGDGSTIPGYETLSERNQRIYRTQPRVVHKNGKDYIMFRDKDLIGVEEAVSLNTDFDADDRWYFKVKYNGKWGVVFVKKADSGKVSGSIHFNYVKIESANNGWAMLNCYLPDGTVELRWYGGSTPEQKSIPTTSPETVPR